MSYTDAAFMDAVHKDRVLYSLRSRLVTLKMASAAKKEADQAYQEVSKRIKEDLLEVDGENGKGIRFWMDGVEYAAMLSKPKQEMSWNLEKLVPYLQEIGQWENVSTRVIDPNKLASEMLVGNIQLTPEQTKEFQYVSKDVSASVRFVSPTPESV